MQANTLLQNRYRIISQVGKGGMGTVYMAKDENLSIIVAVKQNVFTEQRLIEAFKREARLLASLRHPALPQVKDHFIVNDTEQFLVMDFIAGDDLETILEKRRQKISPAGEVKPFDIEQIIHWGEQLLDALDYLHKRPEPIIHRDIKPQNLKLAERNQIILLDFGLAKGKPLQMTRVTTTGSLYGYTPNYAPIEQIRGLGTDPRSDLYALGATLYHLATGLPPVDAATRADFFLGGEIDPLLPVNEVNPKVPQGIATVLMKALEQHRSNRPSSATEMLEMLRAAKHSTVIDWQAREKDEIEKQPKEQKHNAEILRQDAALLKAESDKKHEEEAKRIEEIKQLKLQEEQQKKSIEDAKRQMRIAEELHRQQQEEERKAKEEEIAYLQRKKEEAERKQLQEEQKRRASEEMERKKQQEELRHKAEIERLQRQEEEERKAREQAENHKAKVKQLVSEGIAAFDSGKYRLAIQKWNEVLKVSPKEHGLKESIEKAEALINKEQVRVARVKQLIVDGTQAFDAEQYKLAIDKWNEVLALSPNEPGIKGIVKAAYQRLKEKEETEHFIKAEEQRKGRENAEREAQQRKEEAESLGKKAEKRWTTREEPLKQQKQQNFSQIKEEVFNKANRKRIIIGLISLLLVVICVVAIKGILSASEEIQGSKNSNGQIADVTQPKQSEASAKLKPGVFMTPSEVKKVSLSDDGQILVSAGDENKIRLWQQKSVRMLVGKSQKIHCVAVSRDGQIVVAGGNDGLLSLWRTSDGQLLNTFNAHSDYVFSVGFSLDGQIFYSASADATVKLWRTNNSEPLRTINIPEKGFLIVTISPDLKMVGFYHKDGRFKLWSINEDNFLRYLEDNISSVNCGTFSNDGQMLALGNEKGGIRVWRVSDGRMIKTLATYKGNVVSVAFSSDGQVLAAGFEDGKIKLLRLDDGSLIKTLENHTGAVNSLSFNADRRLLVSGGADAVVQIWSLEW